MKFFSSEEVSVTRKELAEAESQARARLAHYHYDKSVKVVLEQIGRQQAFLREEERWMSRFMDLLEVYIEGMEGKREPSDWFPLMTNVLDILETLRLNGGVPDAVRVEVQTALAEKLVKQVDGVIT